MHYPSGVVPYFVVSLLLWINYEVSFLCYVSLFLSAPALPFGCRWYYVTMLLVDTLTGRLWYKDIGILYISK